MDVYIDYSGLSEGSAVYLWFDSTNPIRFRVPDANDHYPMEWWHIEAITNISASQIARAWRGQTNAKLEQVWLILSTELAIHSEGSFANVDDFRRTIIRQRYLNGYEGSTEPILPAVFTERNDVLLSHTMKLLEDVWGPHRGEWGYLYAVPGEKRYISAALWPDRERHVLRKLDDANEAGWVLRKTVRFSKPGKRPKASASAIAGAAEVDPNYSAVRTASSKAPRELIVDLGMEPCPWPILESIIRVPSVRADGSLLTQVGYDPVARTWYDPDPVFRNVSVPDAPSIDDILRAREILAFPFREFPLVYGYASVIAVILERVCMPMLNGPRPLHIIDAPKRRSGKSLMAKALTACVTGREGGVANWPENDVAMEKMIGSVLRGFRAIATFDNIEADIGPASLAALITSTEFTTRTLGHSEAPPLPNNVTWLATLNKARVNEDFVYRSVLTTIDASIHGVSDPSKRVFENKELIEWCIENRPAIIQAALTLVRAWVVAGKPVDPELVGVLGGFEKWLHVIGGTLFYAGITGLPASIRAVAARDVSREEDQMFLDTWAEKYGYGTVTTTQLAELAAANGFYLKTMAEQKGQWIERRFKEEILDRIASVGRCIRVGESRPVMWILCIPQVVNL